MSEVLILLGLLGWAAALLAAWLGYQTGSKQEKNHTEQLARDVQQATSELEQLRQVAVKAELVSQQFDDEKLLAQKLQQELTLVLQQKAAMESELNALKTSQKDFKDGLWKEWSQHYETFSLKTLKALQEDLQTQAKVSYEDNQKRIHDSVDTMLKPLTEMIKTHEKKVGELEKQTLTETTSLKTQIAQTVQQTEKLVQAKNELVAALTNPKGRGDWGELELIRLLEDSGLQKGVHYEFQVTQTDQSRPDIQLKLPNGHQLFIDAKSLLVPLQKMQEVHEQPDLVANERKKLLESLRREVKSLYEKAYQAKQKDTLDFVVLYVPRESMLRIPLEEDPTLIQDAFQKKVILASPLILMALLKTVAQGWHQVAITEHAREVQEMGVKLHKIAATFLGRFEKLGASIQNLQNQYIETDKSLQGRQGMLPYLNKFEKLGCKSEKQFPEQYTLSDESELILDTDEQAVLESFQTEETVIS